MEKSNEEVSSLRENVTSPGGTTEAALKTLQKNNQYFKLVKKAIISARNRGIELSDEFKKCYQTFMHEKTLKIKEKLAFRLIKLLGKHDWREINNKILLQEIPNEKIKTLEWLANDKAELLKIYFNIINIKILTEAEKDFSDDQEASVREKLVDII